MLQQIATAKSDVAAYAVDVSDESLSKLQNADEFAYMLAKENKTQHSPKETAQPELSTEPKNTAKDKPVPEKQLGTKEEYSHKSPPDDSNTGKASDNKETRKPDSPVDTAHRETGLTADDKQQIDTSKVNTESIRITTDSENEADANHWLSIIEQLALNSAGAINSKGQDNAHVNASMTNVTGNPLNDNELAKNATSDEQALLLALLSHIFGEKTQANADQALAPEHEVADDGTMPTTEDDVGKMMALLQNNPELFKELESLLVSQQQLNDSTRLDTSESLDPLDAIGEHALNSDSQGNELAAPDLTQKLLPQQDKAITDEALAGIAEAVVSLMNVATSAKSDAQNSVSEAVNTVAISATDLLEGSVLSQQSTSQIDPLALARENDLTEQQLAMLDSAPELKKLLQLPPEKLESALALLAKELQKGGAASTTGDASRNAMLKGAVQTEADLSSSANVNLNSLINKVDADSNASGTADFVAALKTGLAEVKAQLEKGREPGIDLKALVNDAIKASPELASNMLPNKQEQLELATRSVSQILDVAQLMSTALEQASHQQTVNTTYRELGINMVEHNKANQLHQGQFDKALNLAKPEAHQQLAEKVRFMVNANQLVADIRLDPAELGSMHVKVSVSGESANVSFVVQSIHAKEAIDNAAPRLKEMLAEKGIELGQSSVEQESQEQDQQMAGGGSGNEPGRSSEQGSADGEVPDGILQQPIVNGSLGGIDYFV
ncbi:MAG: flagellar hook-length control protein FliK [Alteromonadaceae bacterium]|jgi:flagellar hook-length control protein FliK|nr:flagellar hook-length control protein FliK [Alteromonadaceae bacterium]MBB19072.1 flagellar hook-length control protein FliK [Rickettsiales bacterium]